MLNRLSSFCQHQTHFTPLLRVYRLVTLPPYMNLTTGASADRILSLENIRGQLIRLEDTIIFCESCERSSG